MAQFVKTKGDSWIGYTTAPEEPFGVEWIYAPHDDPEPPNWDWQPYIDDELEDLGTDPREIAYRIWAEIAAFGGWINHAALDASGCADELPPPGNVGAVN